MRPLSPSSRFSIAPARRLRSALLRLEALEDRAVPATFQVLNTLDAGPGSLRQAVLDANATSGPDRIVFAHDVRGTIALSSDELQITDDVTVTGPGAGRLKVSGMHVNRVFEVDSASAAISGLTIADGHAYNGAGILTDGGTVTLTAVAVADNLADGYLSDLRIADGGGITALHGSRVTVVDSTFRGNRAAGLFLGAGGAIVTDDESTLAVSGSAFLDNQATAADGGSSASALLGLALGGAIANSGAASITSSTFIGNVARGSDGNGAKSFGGGGTGGAIASLSLSLEGPPKPSQLAVAGSLFIDNLARGGNGVTGGSGGPGAGGAIAVVSGTTATVAGSTFLANQATGGIGAGGGNGGNALGGALADLGATLDVSHDVFLLNGAVAGAGGAGNATGAGGDGGLGRGGAIGSDFSALNAPHLPSVTIDASALLFNQAVGGAGGAASAGGVGGRGGLGGGGGFANTVGTAGVSGTTIDDNRALGGAGGAGASGGDADGGGILNGPGGSSSSGAILTIRGATITRNSATGGPGGTGAVGGLGRGGGVYNTAGSTVDVDAATDIFGNHASTGGDNTYGF
jgi:hypothetical protein